MKSLNFEYFRKHRPELASLGGFAEAYVYSDSASTLVKLRQLIEVLVAVVYEKLKLTKPYQPALIDLLNEDSFKRVVPTVILNKIHIIRKYGNFAAHGETINQKMALIALQESYDLCRWLHVGIYKGSQQELPIFQLPSNQENLSVAALKKNKNLEDQLAQQEAHIQVLLKQLEDQQSLVKPEEKTGKQSAEIYQNNINIVAELAFNEAETRERLIDTHFAEAGWIVSSTQNPQDLKDVITEFEVLHQPTNSGKGYADYVMWGNNGKPLALLEAKKTAASVETGCQQARIYADGLEKMFGQRPIIFYSNGFETYIWNDAQKEPPRRIYGIYSKDSLEYAIAQRIQKKELLQIKPKIDIVDRGYQLQAIKAVSERFAMNYMKSLMVLATGTGKTRIAIALCDVLIHAGWVKRILLLCDRKELRKQANKAFRDFLPNEPRLVISAKTSHDKDKRIYLATYPSMMQCYQSFDVGYFDLIIADESHRSIYNRYRDLFLYFDARQIGLTATPKNFITHNTYKMFGCEEDNPTFFYGYEEAVYHKPPYLCPFEVIEHTTKFMRDGIKYKELSEEQRRQLEEQIEDAENFQADKDAINKQIFNKDTNRSIVRNLMENGIRDASGNKIGKSIIFARNHKHAVLLEELFNEMYPQYGGRFCTLIDNSLGERAEVLIDEFKNPSNDLTIAVSVDMLDTGVDIPEVVNLVFAKPVKSYVKFWQMIGRGTRLCKNLFGIGKDKVKFQIFDHWNNFEFFDEVYKPREPSKQKSLLEKLFLSRIALAETALSRNDVKAYELAIKHLANDLAALPSESISIKEKWREIKLLRHGDTLKNFSSATIYALKNEIAPLMQWRNSRGQDEALVFDSLVTKAQTEFLKVSNDFKTLKFNIVDVASQLPINLNVVHAKQDTIAALKSAKFWQDVTVDHLEHIRLELRDLMKNQDQLDLSGELKPPIIDIKEDSHLILTRQYKGNYKPHELIPYRKRVEEVLLELIDKSPVLKKIKWGEVVIEKDIEDLTALIISLHPDVNLQQIAFIFPGTAGKVENLIRSVIGLEPEAVGKSFEQFMQQHQVLTSKQMKFLDLLQNHIAQYGSIELEKLYEPPFTTIDSNGLDGVFPDALVVDELIATITPFLSK